MVTLDKIHLKIANQNPYFHVDRQLEHGSNIVDCQLKYHELFIDKAKTDENCEPIMVLDPEEGEIPLIETVPFDKGVKGLLRMDFVLDTSGGTVAPAVLLLPEDVEKVLGFSIRSSTTNQTRRNIGKK